MTATIDESASASMVHLSIGQHRDRRPGMTDQLTRPIAPSAEVDHTGLHEDGGRTEAETMIARWEAEVMHPASTRSLAAQLAIPSSLRPSLPRR
jgi:hypothetical protein